MNTQKLNKVARDHGLEERKSVDKTKIKMQELNTELRRVDGKKGRQQFKRKRDEIEDRDFDWASPSQSQSQGKNLLLRLGTSMVDTNQLCSLVFALYHK